MSLVERRSLRLCSFGSRGSHLAVNPHPMMEPQLTNQPVWLKPTPKIRALDGKSVLIKNLTNDREKSATLRVSDGDPQTTEADKCSVAAQQTSVGNVEWTDAGKTPPAEQIHVWRAFLNGPAIDLLRPNDEHPGYGELSLALSFDE